MIPKCGKKFAENLFKEVTDTVSHKDLVYKAYINKFKDQGDFEFEKNYKLLYILDSYEGFEININKYDRKEI